MPKNILIFSDGTGQEGGRGWNTNIYKLFNMVEHRTPRQIAFYDRGVGVGRSMLTGLAGGRGFARNVRDCYSFIFDSYEAGDDIYLFGFSRGAATVRSLSYFIHLFGILPHSRPDLIPLAWKIYSTVDEQSREAQARAFVRKHHTMWVKIHFVGCYDTVAALGLPYRAGSVLLDGLPGLRHRFHNFALSPGVVHAYHALALDDERLTFHPLLWEPLDVTRRRCHELQRRNPSIECDVACETLRQVWFAGMHTDVGGGYPEQQLSDIPLVWLTQHAVAHGLRIYPDHHVDIGEDADGTMHDSRAYGWTRLYRRRVRSWDRAVHGAPVIHESVFERTRGRDNGAGPYRSWLIEDGEHEVEPWTRYADQSWHPRRLALAEVQAMHGLPVVRARADHPRL